MQARPINFVVASLITLLCYGGSSAAVPTVVHYQGVLTDGGGTPIVSNTSVVFTLWTAPIGGAIRWTETRSVTPDSEGRFSILLGQAVPLHDSVFKTPPLYLGVQVDADPEMTPRSLLATNSFAFRIATIDGATGGTLYGGSEILTGGTGDGLGVRDPGGNIGVVNPTFSSFEDADGDVLVEIGTGGLYFVDPSTGDTIFLYNPVGNLLEIGPDNSVAGLNSMAVGFGNSMNSINSSAFGTGNIVNGTGSTAVGNSNTVTRSASSAFGSGNFVDSSDNSCAVGSDNKARGPKSFVCGTRNHASGNTASVFGGDLNRASGALSVNIGGFNNEAAGVNAIVGGGIALWASGDWSSAIGGASNTTIGDYSAVIGGGLSVAAGDYSVVCGGVRCSSSTANTSVMGGEDNKAAGRWSHIGGGFNNRTSDTSCVVAGGTQNRSTEQFATVGGGQVNSAMAPYSTVPGGYANAASGSYSFAAGNNSAALGANSFAIGTGAVAIDAGAFVWADSTGGATSSAKNEFTAKASGGVRFFSNSTSTTGVTLAAGGGSWASVSDRNLKENVELVDGNEVLARLAEIPVAKWNYTSQDKSIRHIGPMAQDFHAAFGVGESDRTITTIDADGVALAAIQALHLQNQELLKRLDAQQRQIDELMKSRAR